MNAKELRIGNLAWSNLANREFLISALTEDYDPMCDPILLTEEWLLKFGFDKPTIVGSYLIKYLDKAERKDPSLQYSFYNNEIQICRSGICAWSFKCTYVHQLQNLYFALTGEELWHKEPSA